jgi:hypothetical protein
MLVVDTGEETIPKSLQLIAGRTAQEFNIRKGRKGAFWEDRYHATAVQTDDHLAKCLVYIDLNMVRTGLVQHPSEYCISGYNEIQNPQQRYSIINRKILLELFGIHDVNLKRILALFPFTGVKYNKCKKNIRGSTICYPRCVTVSTETK